MHWICNKIYANWELRYNNSMKNAPNPNIGDVVTVYRMGEDVSANIVDKGPLKNPNFNYWVAVFDSKEKCKIAWNPFVQAFCIPDYTD